MKTIVPVTISSGEVFFTTEQSSLGAGSITVEAQPASKPFTSKKKLKAAMTAKKILADNATKVIMLDPQESFPKLAKRYLEYEVKVTELDAAIKELQTKKATITSLRASVLAKAGQLLGEGPGKKLIQSGDKLVMFQKPLQGSTTYVYSFSADDLIGIKLDKELLK